MLMQRYALSSLELLVSATGTGKRSEAPACESERQTNRICEGWRMEDGGAAGGWRLSSLAVMRCL